MLQAQLEQEVASLRKELRMVRVEQQHERQQADEAHHEVRPLPQQVVIVVVVPWE